MRKYLVLFVAAMVLFISCTGAFADKKDPYALPIDIRAGGYTPDPKGIKENGYEDESISVRREEIRYNNVDFVVVWVTIKSPTQLRTVCAGAPNANKTALPSRMAKSRNAVFAINGEFYVQRTRDIFVYRQGEMYRNDPDPKKDILIIDENSDFNILVGENKEEQIKAFQKKHTIINAFSFGPALVLDGKMCEIPEDYYFDGQARLARMAIGQVGPLSYVAARCLGKQNNSRGCNHQQMAEFMSTLNVQCAYNLDGGQSCVMLLNGKYADWTRRDTERLQSDIIYFASGVNPGKK